MSSGLESPERLLTLFTVFIFFLIKLSVLRRIYYEDLLLDQMLHFFDKQVDIT